jgi:hypothetical protein
VRWFERPIVWGLAYLALIPLFAVFYYYTADGFYQTSAMHETSALDSEFYVERQIDGSGGRRPGAWRCCPLIAATVFYLHMHTLVELYDSRAGWRHLRRCRWTG